MKPMVSLVAAAMVLASATAFAQGGQPNASPPSAQNSGAGIRGAPGGKSGPAADKGTVGSSATTDRQNPNVSAQDPSGTAGKPGNQSGPALKPAPK
jgi:Spy/CpxP family protein refolding chaperone